MKGRLRLQFQLSSLEDPIGQENPFRFTPNEDGESFVEQLEILKPGFVVESSKNEKWRSFETSTLKNVLVWIFQWFKK